MNIGILTPGKVINPALNTVPYVYILLAHMNAVNKNSKFMDLEVLYDKMTNFLVSFDGRQIRYLGKELAQVIEWVAGIGRNNRQVRLQRVLDEVHS